MKLGTKSVLFGAHCFFLHGWFVAAAWTRLYGFPFDPRLWFCFFLHDIGYIGMDKMDDAIGETHPELGANIVRRLFGDEWGDFCLLHSRYYAKRMGRPFSRLCVADKLQFMMFPKSLYLRMTRATGELDEYLANASAVREANSGSRWKFKDYRNAESEWFDNLCRYMLKWVAKHRYGGPDTWTRNRHAKAANV
jgi:hypothetical protein